jgi:hypothetical protein
MKTVLAFKYGLAVIGLNSCELFVIDGLLEKKWVFFLYVFFSKLVLVSCKSVTCSRSFGLWFNLLCALNFG